MIFAAIAFLCVIGLAMYGVVVLAEHLVMRLLGMPTIATEY
jgi:hypothetical protein